MSRYLSTPTEASKAPHPLGRNAQRRGIPRTTALVGIPHAKSARATHVSLARAMPTRKTPLHDWNLPSRWLGRLWRLAKPPTSSKPWAGLFVARHPTPLCLLLSRKRARKGEPPRETPTCSSPATRTCTFSRRCHVQRQKVDRSLFRRFPRATRVSETISRGCQSIRTPATTMNVAEFDVRIPATTTSEHRGRTL